MIMYALCFLLLLSGFCVINLLIPDRALSASEKRTLADFPTLNTSRLLDGSFSADFEEYASDQIPARDFFIRLRSGFSLLLGKKESQGVYYAEEGYLMERMEPVDEAALSKTLQTICSFSKSTGIPPHWCWRQMPSASTRTFFPPLPSQKIRLSGWIISVHSSQTACPSVT